jgi:hypothetical protein
VVAVAVVISSNIQKVVSDLGLLKNKCGDALKRGIRLGLRDYEAWFVTRQLSGRPGLNRKSGHAADDWFVTTIEQGYKLATSAWYLITHQHAEGFNGIIRAKNKPYLVFRYEGTPKTYSARTGKKLSRAQHTYNWARVKQVYIPKRLTILENYRTIGQELIRTNMIKELQKLKGNPSAITQS